MSNMLIPGTVMPYSNFNANAFSLFEPMIKATGGLTLSQVCTICGLESSTIQNWVKRGWVAKPINKKYHQRQLSRILIISAMRESLQLEQIVNLLKFLNGFVEDETDDIIEESKLYDYLCVVLKNINISTGVDKKRLKQTIDEAIADYSPPYSDSFSRLEKVLMVMSYATLASKLKKETDLIYSLLEGDM